jgi:hypothetical protein
MLACGRASTSVIRKRMDRGWAGRSPDSWSVLALFQDVEHISISTVVRIAQHS